MTETAVKRFQDRVVKMIEDGNTGWHISPGNKWHDLSIEEKCEAILAMWDAPRQPLDFKDSYRKAVDDVNRMNDKGLVPDRDSASGYRVQR